MPLPPIASCRTRRCHSSVIASRATAPNATVTVARLSHGHESLQARRPAAGAGDVHRTGAVALPDAPLRSDPATGATRLRATGVTATAVAGAAAPGAGRLPDAGRRADPVCHRSARLHQRHAVAGTTGGSQPAGTVTAPGGHAQHRPGAGLDPAAGRHACLAVDPQHGLVAGTQRRPGLEPPRRPPSPALRLPQWRRDPKLPRQALQRSLAIEVARAHALGRPLSVLVLYVPQLDQADDQFGTDLREALSHAFSHAVANDSRHSDLLGEYRKSVFCLILPNAGESGALAAGRRLAATVATISRPETGPLESFSRVCMLQPGEATAHFLTRLDNAATKLLEPLA
ncbi:diguanylate cyclase domain-containing protein [Salinicola tamaricis]|uniref:diguanylate cyclase domain-containing protein n=1 Tax=Salinicola tamaricis TaxID=1771309 RepID=UPI001F5E0A87|nr:diguanylate cyclase [Salinicola tamaricis]